MSYALIAVVAFIFGAILFGGQVANDWATLRKQAIDNHCAQFNPTTGKFEWIVK